MTYSATEIKVALREAAQQNGGRATRADAIALLDRSTFVEYDDDRCLFEVHIITHIDPPTGHYGHHYKSFRTREEAEECAWGWVNNCESRVECRMTEYVDTPIGKEPHAVAPIDLQGRFWDWEG